MKSEIESTDEERVALLIADAQKVRLRVPRIAGALPVNLAPKFEGPFFFRADS